MATTRKTTFTRCVAAAMVAAATTHAVYAADAAPSPPPSPAEREREQPGADPLSRTREPKAYAFGVRETAGVRAGEAGEPSSEPQTLAPVRVTGQAAPAAPVTGFGNTPLATTPIAATVVTEATLKDAGITRLSDAARLDPSVNDAYNSEGYISYFTIRGYTLDNRYALRRDGLPISGETSIPLDNKSAVTILKGTTGMQAGTSAPGGLVDLAVKRPLASGGLTVANLEWSQRGNVLGALDVSRRVGSDGEFGWRLNAAAERLDPELRDARGRRHLLALAGDWRNSASGTLVEAEIESSRRTQPSQPGFSLLGDRVPRVTDPRINLNDQRWSQPNVFDATTASLRLTQRIAGDWNVVAHGAVQRLKTDDRLAFPYGCYDAGADTYYADRYCPDGRYDLYDFRSDGERRRVAALDISVHGSAATGPLGHAMTFGALRSTYRLRVNDSAFNLAGTGNVDGTAQVPAAPDLVVPQTHRDERATELYARDRIALGRSGAALWLGLRHSRIERSSVMTDGSAATAYAQRFTTPFAAASWAFAPGRIVYASWGRGVESDVTPNLPLYADPGRPLPAARSRQVELGLKGATERTEWSLAAFDIVRPLYGDRCTDDGEGGSLCTRALDGTQRHRGLEAQGSVRLGWFGGPAGTTLRAAGQWLHARVDGRADSSLNGLKPVNVPAYTVRAGIDQALPIGQPLVASIDLAHEGKRIVLPDNSLQIGGWSRFDLGLRWQHQAAGVKWTVRGGIDNLFDRRAWKESPYQFAHVYLFPLQGRTARLSLQAEL